MCLIMYIYTSSTSQTYVEEMSSQEAILPDLWAATWQIASVRGGPCLGWEPVGMGEVMDFQQFLREWFGIHSDNLT